MTKAYGRIMVYFRVNAYVWSDALVRGAACVRTKTF